MTFAPQHIPGVTFHGRRGAVENAFRYRVDYVLLDAELGAGGAWPFRRNRRGAVALHDCDHGGPPGAGQGAPWARAVLDANGLGAICNGRLLLMAQPRILGHVFNPVSFWLAQDSTGALRAVIAEVTNTYGDRHSYLCQHDDLRAITKKDTLAATKIFHVSPFQPVAGGYRFRFDIRPDKVGIFIDYQTDGAGLLATLTGPRQPITTRGLIGACLRRPLGSRRVLALIHWQALRLWWKGAAFRGRPVPPVADVSGHGVAPVEAAE